MNRLLSFSPQYPWPVLIFLVLATALSALQLENLSLRIRSEAMMSEEAEPRRIYDAVIERFGSDNTTIILLSDPDLFSPEKLRLVKEAVDTLGALSFVVSTDSLFSIASLLLPFFLIAIMLQTAHNDGASLRREAKQQHCPTQSPQQPGTEVGLCSTINVFGRCDNNSCCLYQKTRTY